VEHKDIKSFSIYANQLTEKAKQVVHGWIREVSLVMAGANPGALIDNITLQHGNGELETLDDEAIIYTDTEIVHGSGEAQKTPEEKEDETEETEVEHTADDPTIQEVYDGMTDDEKNVVHYMIGQALEEAKSKNDSAQHSAGGEESNNDDKEGKGRMSQRSNVFETHGKPGGEESERTVLSHEDVQGIVSDAMKLGSMKEAVEAYAVKHGIENLDVLFPDAKAVDQMPEFDSRRVEWVQQVINGTRKVPFSRIKNLWADITHDEARAKGYIKGTFKKEEWFALAKRVTTPATIYKKQKLDRDDIIDITTLDVVAWMKGEMRLMFDEELARAILIGDGRAFDDEDKIKDPAGANEGAGIRSIANDHELYAATITLPVDLTGNGQNAVIDELLRSMRFYKGSGSPTFFTTLPMLTWLLLARDGTNRRYYRTAGDLAAELGVDKIVTVEVMEGEEDLVGIIVNLKDYTIGADRGGDVAFFDDFDIDYNQYKYLLESRLSGALTKIRSALVVRRADAGDVQAVPAAPDFDPDTGEITINDTAGVVYRRSDTNAVVDAAGSPYVVAAGDSLTITSEPDATHYFENNVEDEWTFNRPA
jgi:hypothetical protein